MLWPPAKPHKAFRLTSAPLQEQAAVAQRRGPDAVKVAHIPGSDAFAAVPSVRSALLNPGRGASNPSGRTLQHLMRSMAIPTACDSSGACPGAPPGADGSGLQRWPASAWLPAQ